MAPKLKDNNNDRGNNRKVFDNDSRDVLVSQWSVFGGRQRLDVRAHFYSDGAVTEADLLPTKKGVSLTVEKAAWLLPELARFVTAETALKDTPPGYESDIQEQIEEAFVALQSYLER